MTEIGGVADITDQLSTMSTDSSVQTNNEQLIPADPPNPQLVDNQWTQSNVHHKDNNNNSI